MSSAKDGSAAPLGGHDRLAFGVIAAVALVSALVPVLAFWWTTPPDHHFLGYVLGSDDYYTFLAKIQEGFDGAWLFTNRFTYEQHRPAPIYLLYLMIGHACRIVGMPLWVGFHGARALLLPATLWSAWRFYGAEATSRTERRVALILSLVLSGPLLLLPVSNDIRLIDTHPAEHLYTALWAPHYLVSYVALLTYLRLAHTGSGRWGAKWVALVALTLVHPFLLLPALVVPVLAVLPDWKDVIRRARHAALLTFAILPLVLLIGSSLYMDPVLASWREQAISIFPRWWLLPVWFGPGILLAWLGYRRHPQSRLAVTWSGVAVALVNVPLLANRWEFAMALGVPLSLFVARALLALMAPLREASLALRAVVWPVLVAACGATGLAIVLGAVLTPFNLMDESVRRHYVSAGLLQGVSHLAQQAAPGTVVFTDPAAGAIVAATTRLTVTLGHRVETIDFQHRLQEAQAIFDGTMPALEAEALLCKMNAGFVLADRYHHNDMRGEPNLPADGVGRYPFLRRVRDTQDFVLYRTDLLCK